jgi:hypothetical protein
MVSGREAAAAGERLRVTIAASAKADGRNVARVAEVAGP